MMLELLMKMTMKRRRIGKKGEISSHERGGFLPFLLVLVVFFLPCFLLHFILVAKNQIWWQFERWKKERIRLPDFLLGSLLSIEPFLKSLRALKSFKNNLQNKGVLVKYSFL